MYPWENYISNKDSERKCNDKPKTKISSQTKKWRTSEYNNVGNLGKSMSACWWNSTASLISSVWGDGEHYKQSTYSDSHTLNHVLRPHVSGDAK